MPRTDRLFDLITLLRDGRAHRAQDLAAAARALEARIEAATPTQALAEAEAWKTAVSPWSDTARGLSHLAILRGAIEGRQKLRLTCRDAGGACQVRTVRPLKLDNWGRVWSLAAWCEEEAGFRDLRLDLIEEAQALPELFLDEPGKRLSDRAP